MAVLSLLVVCGAIYSAVIAILTTRAYFGLWKNRAFAPEYPNIDPPLWRVALRHIAGLLSTVLWLLRWPSFTEVWMALCLVPLLFVPYPLILNNVLEWFMFLVFGNAQSNSTSPTAAARGDVGLIKRWSIGVTELLWRAKTIVTDAASLLGAWWRMVWLGRKPEGAINYNYSLLCYLQNESWSGMHHLDKDVLQDFPTPAPNSRANAVMMARCATMSYDRWHNIDQAVSVNWNKGLSPTGQDPKYSLLKAWSFDRVIVPSDVEPLPTDPDSSTTTAAQNGNNSASTSGPAGTSWATSSKTSRRMEITPTTAQGSLTTGSDAAGSTIFNIVNGVYGAAAGALQTAQGQVTALKSNISDGTYRTIQNFVFWSAKAPSTRDKPILEEHTAINTDAFLLKAVSDKPDPKTGGNVVALVLAFRGTEALQTVDWISDLAQVNPPWYALKPTYFPLGFTHQGFRDSLGLRRDLTSADGLEKFTSSYLVYEPNPSGGPMAPQQAAELSAAGGFMRSPSPAAGTGAAGLNATPWSIGALKRIPKSDQEPRSPFAVITAEIDGIVNGTVAEMGHNTTIKLFVTGHSLGGALAHMYTGALLLHQTSSEANATAANSLEGLYTFGEPRIGSQAFVSRVNAEMQALKDQSVPAEDRFKRVVNTLDVVTRIPPPLGQLYQHPAQCTFVKPHFAITTSGGPAASAATVAVEAEVPATAAAAAADEPIATSDIGSSAVEPPAAADEDKGKKKKFGLLRSRSLRRDQVPELPPAATSTEVLPATTDATAPSTATAAPAPTDRMLPAATAPAIDSSYSPVTNLTETPDIFLGPTVLTVTLKLVLSVLLLISTTVSHAVKKYGSAYTAAGALAAAVVFWPITLAVVAGSFITAAIGAALITVLGPGVVFVYLVWPKLYDQVLSPPMTELKVSWQMLIQSLTQPDSLRPSLIGNPMYLITRLVALLGPAPIALLLDVLLLPVVVFSPVLWWTLITEPVLLLLLFAFMPPFIIGGLIDHSMAEYYTACWLTNDSDWVMAQRQPVAHDTGNAELGWLLSLTSSLTSSWSV